MEEPTISSDKSPRQSETKSQNLLYAKFIFSLDHWNFLQQYYLLPFPFFKKKKSILREYF